jgi:hypothetical protein
MKTFDKDKNSAIPKEEDFNIRIRPALDGDKWTGEITISVLASTNSDLDEESYNQIMHFCTMMCATVPLMEEDEDMRDYVHDYVMSEFHSRGEEILEKKVDTSTEYANVISMNFKTGKIIH